MADRIDPSRLQPTRLDKVVGWFSPRAAASRTYHRAIQEQLALVGGYYRGARSGRTLGGWQVSRGDANSHLRDQVQNLRADSFDLYTNNALAVSAVNSETDNVVGPGLKPHPSFDIDFLGISEDEAAEVTGLLQQEWKIFSRTCDSTLMNSFEEQQEVALRSVILSGDTFVNLPYLPRQAKGIEYELSVNLIEAHRVKNKDNLQDGAKLIMGVQLDNDGAPEKYHVMTRHPDSDTDASKEVWQLMDIWGPNGNRQILHLFKQARPNGVRGAPWLAPIIEPLKKLDTVTQAEIDAAVLNSFFTVFLKQMMPNDNGSIPLDVLTNVGQSDSAGDLTLGSANIVQLHANEEVEFADPSRSHAEFATMYKLIATQIGSALGIPYEVLMKQFDSSYSASRGALIEAWKHFSTSRQWLVNSFCQPVYEEFLFEVAAKNIVPLKNYVNDLRFRMAWSQCEWVGPEQGQLNPLDEAKAAEVLLRNNMTSRQKVAANSGNNWNDTHRANAIAANKMVKDGLAADTYLKEVQTEDDNDNVTDKDEQN